jgi:hypothetical protein
LPQPASVARKAGISSNFPARRSAFEGIVGFLTV